MLTKVDIALETIRKGIVSEIEDECESEIGVLEDYIAEIEAGEPVLFPEINTKIKPVEALLLYVLDSKPFHVQLIAYMQHVGQIPFGSHNTLRALAQRSTIGAEDIVDKHKLKQLRSALNLEPTHTPMTPEYFKELAEALIGRISDSTTKIENLQHRFFRQAYNEYVIEQTIADAVAKATAPRQNGGSRSL